MNATPERLDAHVLAGDVEAVGVGEHRRVAVGRGDDTQHTLAALDVGAIHLRVFQRRTVSRLQGRFEPQDFFHHARRQRRVGHQQLPLFWEALQRIQPVADEVRRGFEACAEHGDDDGNHFAMRQGIAGFVANGSQRRGQVIARVGLASVKQRAEVVVEVIHLPIGQRQFASVQNARFKHQKRLGNGPRQLRHGVRRALALFHAEQVEHDQHRQGISEVVNDIARAALGEPGVDEAVLQGLNPRRHVGDTLWSERKADELAQPRMVRRVLHQEDFRQPAIGALPKDVEVGPVKQLDVADEIALTKGRAGQHLPAIQVARGHVVTACRRMQTGNGLQTTVGGVRVPHERLVSGVEAISVFGHAGAHAGIPKVRTCNRPTRRRYAAALRNPRGCCRKAVP